MKKKKKILFIDTNSEPITGAANCAFDIVKGLKKNGNEVIVWCQSEGGMTKKFRNIGVKTITKMQLLRYWTIPIPTNFLKKFFLKIAFLLSYYYLFVWTKKLLIENNIEIVHINEITTGFGAPAAIRLKIPLVWHIRENLVTDLKRQFVFQSISTSLINKASHIIYISKDVQQAHSYINNRNYSIVYDGVDYKRFNCIDDKFNNKYISIATLGRLCKQKGQLEICEAVDSLTQLGYPIKLFLAGNIEDKRYFDKIDSIVKSNNNINYLGFLKDPSNIYNMCDIFCMNSEREGFGLVAVEAMMSGCLTVLNYSGALKELIIHMKTGIFFSSDFSKNNNSKFDDLATTLQFIHNNQELCKKISNYGKTYSKKFDLSNNLSQIEKIYDNVW